MEKKMKKKKNNNHLSSSSTIDLLLTAYLLKNLCVTSVSQFVEYDALLINEFFNELTGVTSWLKIKF